MVGGWLGALLREIVGTFLTQQFQKLAIILRAYESLFLTLKCVEKKVGKQNYKKLFGSVVFSSGTWLLSVKKLSERQSDNAATLLHCSIVLRIHIMTFSKLGLQSLCGILCSQRPTFLGSRVIPCSTDLMISSFISSKSRLAKLSRS